MQATFVFIVHVIPYNNVIISLDYFKDERKNIVKKCRRQIVKTFESNTISHIPPLRNCGTKQFWVFEISISKDYHLKSMHVAGTHCTRSALGISREHSLYIILEPRIVVNYITIVLLCIVYLNDCVRNSRQTDWQMLSRTLNGSEEEKPNESKMIRVGNKK